MTCTVDWVVDGCGARDGPRDGVLGSMGGYDGTRPADGW